MKTGFIGGGNMAEAIIAAILRKQIALPEDITVSDIARTRREYLQERYGVVVQDDNLLAISDKDLVVLAIKPQVLDEVAKGLKGKIEPGLPILSILAGKSIDTLSSKLGHQAIIRSMPNTPAQIGEGVAVWTITPQVSAEGKARAALVLGSMGSEIFVDDEKYLDMATAVSGSGPAYVFLFIEAMSSAAEKLGFSRQDAQKLVLETLLGSVHLLQKSAKTAQELRRMVTSPGGTTAAAIDAFEKGGFNQLVELAIKAAHSRAKELGS